MIAIQAAIGAKIIARETISALRKDVTAKLWGRHQPETQIVGEAKERKKKMRQIGSVEVPQKHSLTFWSWNNPK